MSELRVAIIIACIIAAHSWYRAGEKNSRFRISRWAVMMIPILRALFYVIKLLGICTPATLNTLSSALILQTLITLSIWGWMVAGE